MKKYWSSSLSFCSVAFRAWLSEMPTWMSKHTAECSSITRISNMCWNLDGFENLICLQLNILSPLCTELLAFNLDGSVTFQFLAMTTEIFTCQHLRFYFLHILFIILLVVSFIFLSMYMPDRHTGSTVGNNHLFSYDWIYLF